MFKLLVLSCLLVSCLADPFGLPSWLREAGRRQRHPRGCRDRAEGWRACARLNGTSALAPHAADCSVFFYCVEGARPACRHCPAGLHFNPQLQVCDWPANVACSPRPPRPSRPPLDGSSTPYPTTPDAEASVSVNDYPSSSTAEPSADPSTSETPPLSETPRSSEIPPSSETPPSSEIPPSSETSISYEVSSPVGTRWWIE